MKQILKRYFFGSLKESNKIRNPGYSQITPADIQKFKSFLKEGQVQTQDLEIYNNDWLRQFKGNSQLALLPHSTEQVSQILNYCYERNLAVVPQSGNTGLVGGSVPVFDEVVVSLKKMNKIINFDEKTNVLTAESGVILEQANQYLQTYKCELPWDLGAKGSCLIGGNTATHAGGKYYVKYGPMRGSILGMEVVLANGQILDMLQSVRKDNTGIDLKQLFIGSEGALGIITKLNMFCQNIDKNRNVILIKCKNFNSILQVYYKSREVLGKNLAAIEWMDGWAMESVLQAYTKLFQDPFNQKNKKSDYYVLVEVSSNQALDQIIEDLYQNLSKIDGFNDCVLSENEKQFSDLWSLRELCAPSVGETNKSQFMYDISLDISKMDEITQILRKKLDNFHECKVIGYGHIGDSNLHIQVGFQDESQSEQILKQIEPFLFQYLQKLKGSISAEHGIGVQKRDFLNYQKDIGQITLMKQIKQLFDDKNILNPYKMLPDL